MTRLLIPRAYQPHGVVEPNRAHVFGAECDYLWTPGNDGGKVPKVRTFNGLAGVPNTSYSTGTSRNLGARPWCSVLVMVFPSATQSGTLFDAGNSTGGARLLVATGGSSIQLNWVANTVVSGANQIVETGISAFNNIAGVLVTNWTASGHTSWFKRPGKPVFTWSESLAIVSPTNFSVVLRASGTIGLELAAISSGVLNPTQARSLLENPWQILRPLARNSRVWASAGGAVKDFAAAGSAQANASADLLHGVTLAGAGLSVAGATAGMLHTVPLSASATARSLAGGQMAITVNFSAGAVAQAAATAGMGLDKPLAATGAAQAVGTATLSLVVNLSATAVAQANGSAAFQGAVNLAAAAIASAQASAALAVGKSLGAAGQAQASSGATMWLEVPLSAAALAQASAGGSLSLTVNLAAAGLGQSSASAMLVGDVVLVASGAAVATGSASLQVSGPLSGTASMVARAARRRWTSLEFVRGWQSAERRRPWTARVA